MNGCDAIREELKAYADGELSWGARRAVRRHLAGCAACRKELEVMEKVGYELRVQDTGVLNPALKARILAGLPERAPGDATTAKRPAGPRWLELSIAGGLVAV